MFSISIERSTIAVLTLLSWSFEAESKSNYKMAFLFVHVRMTCLNVWRRGVRRCPMGPRDVVLNLHWTLVITIYWDDWLDVRRSDSDRPHMLANISILIRKVFSMLHWPVEESTPSKSIFHRIIIIVLKQNTVRYHSL